MVSERDNFIFNSFGNFKPVKRFQNRSDVFEFWSLRQQFEQENSGCVRYDLFDILEDRSTESYSSQVWNVNWRWQLVLQCEGQGRDGYSREHEM